MRILDAGHRLLATTGARTRARDRDVVGLPAPAGPPSGRLQVGELASPLAATRLAAAAPRLLAAPRGDGHLVVDVPGWRAPELTGAPLRAYLRRLGYDARSWGFGTNVGDTGADVDRLSSRLLELVEQTGRPASLVGWSLGGVVAREVARRHPEAVRRVVTYGTPVVGGPTFTSAARSFETAPDREGWRLAERLDAESPISVPLTAMYSRRDGVVSWQACLDRRTPGAEHVEVRSTHVGMGVDPDVWAVVADRLARSAAPD